MKEAVKNLIESMDELMNRLMKETVNLIYRCGLNFYY